MSLLFLKNNERTEDSYQSSNKVTFPGSTNTQQRRNRFVATNEKRTYIKYFTYEIYYVRTYFASNFERVIGTRPGHVCTGEWTALGTGEGLGALIAVVRQPQRWSTTKQIKGGEAE